MIARVYHPLIGVMTVVLAASSVRTTTVRDKLQRCSVNSTVACLGPRPPRHLNSGNETSRERAENGNGEGTLYESVLRDFKQLWLPHKGNHSDSRTRGDLTSEQRGYLLHRKMMVPLMIGIVLMMKSIIPIVLSKLAFMGISSIISSKIALFLLAMLTLRKMFFSMDQHEQHQGHYAPSLPHLYDPHHGVSASDNKRVYITRGRQLGGDDFWKTSSGESRPTQQTVDVEDEQIERTPRGGSVRFVDTYQMYSNRSKESKHVSNHDTLNNIAGLSNIHKINFLNNSIDGNGALNYNSNQNKSRFIQNNETFSTTQRYIAFDLRRNPIISVNPNETQSNIETIPVSTEQNQENIQIESIQHVFEPIKAPIQIAKRRLKKKPQREIYIYSDKAIHHQDEMSRDETSDGSRRLVKRHPDYLVESDVSDLSSHQSDWRRLDGVEDIHLD